MALLALVIVAVGAIIARLLPQILEILRLKKWADTMPGPTIAEMIETARKGQIIAWYKDSCRRFGSTFRLWFGKDLFVYFTDPQDVKDILSNNKLMHKSRTYDIVKPWLGNSVFTTSGEQWHSRRKMLTPAFHFRILGEFKEPMEENCKIFLNRLSEKAASGESFDIYPYITLFALDVIYETAMGITRNTQMGSDSEYAKAVETICRLLYMKNFSFWQRINVFFKYTKAGREVEATLKILHDETDRVIKMRRNLLLQDQKISSKADDFETKRRLPFLDMLLLAQMEGSPLSDQNIREEVDTFLFAGHDTTSSTLGFVIFLLSLHPEVQQRAYEEVVALQGQEKESMPYLESVIKETLRLYPTVPVFTRLLTEDLQLRKLTVPKGASVGILAYMIHRNETYFPEPEKFDPNRFLLNEKDIHPFAFVPFSAGGRNCIGQKFALLELKSTLSALLRSYEILPAKGFEPKLVNQFVLKSANGIQIRLKARKASDQ